MCKKHLDKRQLLRGIESGIYIMKDINPKYKGFYRAGVIGLKSVTTNADKRLRDVRRGNRVNDWQYLCIAGIKRILKETGVDKNLYTAETILHGELLKQFVTNLSSHFITHESEKAVISVFNEIVNEYKIKSFRNGEELYCFTD